MNTITNEFKLSVVAAVKVARENFGGSDAKHAVSLGINTAQYSRIINGDVEKVLSDQNWISIARLLQVNLRGGNNWKVVKTHTFIYITEQLKHCQKYSIAGLFCDKTDIGKTVAAREYARTNKNAIYIDCSLVKTKQKFVRAIAEKFGVGHTGKYTDVFADLVFYINNNLYGHRPIIILDEAGDLSYEAFLEIKALWNATEGACAWYMLGADALAEKIRRGQDNKKVGFAEIFRRFGKRYQSVVPKGKEDAEQFTREQAAVIIKANAPEGISIQKMIKDSEGSLTRIFNEITKLVA